jgi:hypothetical protein
MGRFSWEDATLDSTIWGNYYASINNTHTDDYSFVGLDRNALGAAGNLTTLGVLVAKNPLHSLVLVVVFLERSLARTQTRHPLPGTGACHDLEVTAPVVDHPLLLRGWRKPCGGNGHRRRNREASLVACVVPEGQRILTQGSKQATGVLG